MTLSLMNQGFDYVAYYNGAYENDDSLDALDATGANAIETSIEYGIDPKTSTVYADTNYTDSLSALGATIRQAVALGLSVMVRPLIDFVDPSDLTGTPYSVGDWRTYFNPGAAGSAGADAFFASYKTMILQQAQVASANGATSLCIGTELDQIAGPAYKSYWDSIISALRAEYPSLKLTYAADWDSDLSPWQWGGTGLPTGTGDLATQVSFASELDSIGVDCYAPISDAASPTLAQLIAGWTETPTDPTTLAVTGGQSLIAYFESVATAVGKPLIFTELGYENATDAASQPPGSSTNLVDSSLQSELYQAFFEAWRQAGNSSLTGVYFWNWDPNAGEVGPGEGANFSPQGLPAQGVASDWFGPGLAVAFNAPTFGATGAITLTGMASDTAGAQSVEVFSGASDVGSATVNAETGAWSFSATLAAGAYQFGVSATDRDGKPSAALASFVVVTGLTGEPYSSYVNDYGASGALTSQSLYGATGALIRQSFYDATGAGSATIVFEAGAEATLVISNGIGGSSAIEGFGTGDSIDFGSLGYAAGDHVVLQTTQSGNATFAIETSSDSVLITLEFDGSYQTSSFHLGADSGGNILLNYTQRLADTNDFTGTGMSDILWRNSDGDTYLWEPDGSGGFAGDDFGIVSTSWQVAATGDFTGNGLSDILWRNSDGDTYLWKPNGSGGFTGDDIGMVSTSWQVAGTGDFTGDGMSDILWRKSDGDTSLWDPNGSGGFTAEDLGVVSTSWRIAGTGDFTGNGLSDILWRNSNGDTYLWKSNGSGGFTGDDIGIVSTAWQIAGTGDFTGSGLSDILWRKSDGDTSLWDPNGSGGFTAEDLGVVSTSWQIAGIGDFTGNGLSDILWRNSNGDTDIWKSNGSGGFTGDDIGIVSTAWKIQGV